MYLALFYYSLLVLLACGVIGTTCLNAYFVSRRRTDLWMAVAYLFYFVDAALVYQDDFVTHSGAFLKRSFYYIGHPVMSAITGAAAFGLLWISSCEYLQVHGRAQRIVPVATLASASLLSYALVPDPRVREFCYFSVRELFMGLLLARYALAYATSTGARRAALGRQRAPLVITAILTICTLMENVLFMLVFEPSRLTSDFLWFFAERNISENALFLWIGANAVASAARTLRARAAEPATGEDASRYVEAKLPSYAQEHGLSPRERDVLRLVLEGMDNQNMASTLGIAPSTVKVHVHNVLKKCGAQNRTELTHSFWSS